MRQVVRMHVIIHRMVTVFGVARHQFRHRVRGSCCKSLVCKSLRVCSAQLPKLDVAGSNPVARSTASAGHRRPIVATPASF